MKPTKIPDIWAFDDDYILGPKLNQPTKTPIGVPISAAGQGHFPGKDFPTTSNEFNRWCFDISEVSVWTMAGRFDRDQSAHIAEKDMTGKLSSALAHFGGTSATGPSLLVDENASGVSLQVNANDNRAVRIDSSISAGQFHESMIIASDMGGLEALGIVHVTGTPVTAGQGAAGLIIATDGHTEDSVTSFKYGSLFAQNTKGPSANFAGFDLDWAVRITNTENDLNGGNTALFVGYSADDASGAVRGYGNDAVLAIGYDGMAISGNAFDGGIGVTTRGGYGNQGGAVNTDGGLGLWAIGGDSDVGGSGAPAALFWGGARFDPAVTIELDPGLSGSGGNTALLQINTPTSGTSVQLDGIDVDATENGVGMRIRHGRNYGISLNPIESSGGVLLPQIHMGSLDRPPDSTDEGDLWFMKHPVDSKWQLKCDLGNKRVIPFGHEFCYAFQQAGSTTLTSGGQELLVVATFPSLFEPFQPTAIIATCYVDIDGVGITNGDESPFQLELKSLTDSVEIIPTHFGGTLLESGGLNRQHITMISEYNLVSAGTHSFQFRIRADPNGIDFDIVIARATLEIRQKPSGP